MISVQRNERHFESIDEAVAISVFFFVGRCRGWGLGEGPIFMSHERFWNSKRLLDIDWYITLYDWKNSNGYNFGVHSVYSLSQ